MNEDLRVLGRFIFLWLFFLFNERCHFKEEYMNNGSKTILLNFMHYVFHYFEMFC